ncbi:MAG: AMP-binding protein [Deltaproteobacteria bacterium]|nr:AMP-binding protein [Deltaproteobacteria bacterium]
MNLAQKLSNVARRYGSKLSIIFEDAAYTFDDVDNRVQRYSSLLHRLGVRAGDRVAIQLPKRMEFIFLELAVLSVGGITLPLNPDYRPDELEYFLTDSRSSLFFSDTERFSRARATLQKLGHIRTILVDSTEEAEYLSLSLELERTDPNYTRPYPSKDDDVAVICYTSGTTGRSKGAMLSHKNLVANMTDLHEVWEWSDQDVLVHALPLFHVHGLFVALHGGLNAGATIIMHEKFDARRVWETLEKAKCTVFMGVPTMYQRMMNEWERMERKPDLKGMRLFISGSAPLLETQFLRFERETGFRILERYGMTETNMLTSNTIEQAGRKAQSVGYPLPKTEVRVVSQDGKDVTPGQVGEVWVRGDNVFKGYWEMPEKTRESFQEDWFKTGDLGYQDPQDGGRLYLVGRAKELIITGGYNVYPKEVENVLEGHEAIREAAVIGIPDEDFGERVVAVVVCREVDPKISPESIISFCKAALASYKCPKEVSFVEQLPRNAMGKLQKNTLRETLSKRGQ